MQKNYNAIKKCFIVAFPEGVHALKECDFAISDADFANTGVFTHIFINKLSWHLFNLFSSFQPNINFLQKIYVKNVHSVYGAGIGTHDLQKMSPLP